MPIVARLYAIVIVLGQGIRSVGDDKRQSVNMKVVGNFLILVFYLLAWHRMWRWILTKPLRNPPSLVVSHGISLSSALLLYDYLKGPFAWIYLLSAQAFFFASDWLEQRRMRTLAPGS